MALDTSFGDIDDDEDGPVMPGSDDELEDLQWDDEEEFEDTLPSAVESLATLSLTSPTPLPAAVTPAAVGLGPPTPLPAAVTPAAAGLGPPIPLPAAVTPAAEGLGPPTPLFTQYYS